MKTLLPKTSKNTQGFTLIELLVVIAIIAILAVIGITLFTGTQQKARDSKRIQDITAMSKAMEVNYVSGTGYTTPLSGTWFSDGVTPKAPTPGVANYYTNSPTTAAYVFCAALENGANGANSTASNAVTPGAGASYFCKANQQ